MSELTRYRSQELTRQQRDQIQHIAEVTQAVQWEIGRIHTEGAKMAVKTLTQTTERIQAAARNGMSDAQVESLIEQQKQYLLTMQRIASQGAGGLTGVVANLPALPEPR